LKRAGLPAVAGSASFTSFHKPENITSKLRPN
jgi:hypothetical protein